MAKKRKITRMTDLIMYLEAAFNSINKAYYNGELQKVIITVKEGRKKHAKGWIEVNPKWKQKGEPRHEINISADYLGTDTVQEVITTLMHEMCHLYAIQNEMQDTSRSGLYHNKVFKLIAETHGLIAEEIPQHGFTQTRPTEETTKWIDENVNISEICIYKDTGASKPTGDSKGGTGENEDENGNQSNGKRKQSYRKMICPKCGNIARITKDFKLICGECLALMIEAE